MLLRKKVRSIFKTLIQEKQSRFHLDRETGEWLLAGLAGTAWVSAHPVEMRFVYLLHWNPLR